MKIGIIQLSDIHITNSSDFILKESTSIASTIIDALPDVDNIILILSGDISYSGTKEQYNLSAQFIDRIINDIISKVNITPKIVIIPGNHDCDFDLDNLSRKNLLPVVLAGGSESFDQSVIDTLTLPQTHYFDFNEKYINTKELLFNSKLLRIYNFVFDKDYKIVVNAYNTSFNSKIKERQGDLMFPIEYFDSKIFHNKANLICSTFHHPYNWFEATNGRKFKNHVEEVSDIAFSGHEHMSTKSIKDNLEGNKVFVVEGAVLQESQESDLSAFNILIFDLEKKQYKIGIAQLNDEFYRHNLYETEYRAYDKQLVSHESTYNSSVEFSQWLDDIGANFTHPHKSNVSLSDLYVFPNFKNFRIVETETDKSILNDTVNSFDVISSITTKNKIVITGNENSGKTTFCKVIYRYLISLGYLPVILDGHKIKSSTEEEINKLIKANLIKQYINGKTLSEMPLNHSALFIIIDDFDKTTLNEKYRNRLLNLFATKYKNVCITAGELFSLEEFVLQTNLSEFLSAFSFYSLMEFGHKLRNELVNKWNTLGVADVITQDERLRKNDECERVINAVVGHNFVPSYPIFVLTILQSIEAGKPHDLKEGTYGFYYQILISSSLGKLVKTTDEVDKFYNYLAELSYLFYSKRIFDISNAEFETFHKKYCIDYDVTFTFESVVSTLTACHIIRKYGDSYEFKYRYVFYYFVAKYFSDNIDLPQIRTDISAMCIRLHQTQSANIILFLTHHSKNNFILSEVLRSAKDQFNDFVPTKLENDIEAINKLFGDIPKLIVNDKNIEDHRAEIHDANDKANELIVENDDDLNLQENVDGLDLVSRLNRANKTLEILGQLLKNHYASIKATDKYDLILESYMMGLRTLNSFFAALLSSTDMITSMVNEAIEKKGTTDPKTKEKIARRIIFLITLRVSHSFIKKVSNSVGTEKLAETFKKIPKENDTNAVHLIDVAIQLEYYNGFPFAILKQLKHRFSGNPLALTLLRKFIVDYLYMFPTNRNERQKINDLLDIPISSQFAISANSEQQKK